MFKLAIRALRNKIANLIQRGFVTNANPVVPGQYPVFQSQSLKKVADVENISPYGFISVAPVGSLSTKWNVQGESSAQVGLAYDPATLPALQINEAAVGAFSAQSSTYLKFTNQGTIEIWKAGVLVIADLITHIHSGVTTGAGVSGPPVT